MLTDIRKPPLRQSAPGFRAELGVKWVPGPALRDTGGMMPCGCKIEVDPDSELRYRFCSPHALAYEMLGSLQAIQPVIDDLVKNVNADYDATPAMEAGIKVRKVLQRAKGDWR